VVNKPVTTMPKKSRNPFLSEKYVWIHSALCSEALQVDREGLVFPDQPCGCREGMLYCLDIRGQEPAEGTGKAQACPRRSIPITVIPGGSSSGMRCGAGFVLDCLPSLSPDMAGKGVLQGAESVSKTEGQKTRKL